LIYANEDITRYSKVPWKKEIPEIACNPGKGNVI
jgi:hypothetical protein